MKTKKLIKLCELDTGTCFRLKGKIYKIVGQSWEILSRDPVKINKLYEAEDFYFDLFYFDNQVEVEEIEEIQ